MSENAQRAQREPRDDWGAAFRAACAKGRGAAALTLLVALPLIGWTEGPAQWFGLVAGLVALSALFPRSPVISAVVERIPGLPTKGGGS